MRQIFSAFCVSLVILGSVACGNAATQTPAPTATIELPVQLRVVPQKLKPGVRATMVGIGFERGEIVTFYLTRPDGSKTSEGETKADPSGGAAYEIDVMPDWQPGQYVVHVRSKKNPARRAEQKVELEDK